MKEEKREGSGTIEIKMEVILREGEGGIRFSKGKYTFKTWNGKEFDKYPRWALKKRFEEGNTVWEEFKRLLRERIPKIAEKVKLAGAYQPFTKQGLFGMTLWHFVRSYWLVELTEEEIKKLKEVCEKLEYSGSPVVRVRYYKVGDKMKEENKVYRSIEEFKEECFPELKEEEWDEIMKKSPEDIGKKLTKRSLSKLKEKDKEEEDKSDKEKGLGNLLLTLFGILYGCFGMCFGVLKGKLLIFLIGFSTLHFIIFHAYKTGVIE